MLISVLIVAVIGGIWLFKTVSEMENPTGSQGTSVGFVQKINNSERYKTTAKVLIIAMGTAILLIGFHMFWLAF